MYIVIILDCLIHIHSYYTELFTGDWQIFSHEFTELMGAEL